MRETQEEWICLSGLGLSAQLCLTPRPCSPVVLNPICLLEPPRTRGKCQWLGPTPSQVTTSGGGAQHWCFQNISDSSASGNHNHEATPDASSLSLSPPSPPPHRSGLSPTLFGFSEIPQSHQLVHGGPTKEGGIQEWFFLSQMWAGFPYQLHINMSGEYHANCTVSKQQF